MIKWLAPVLFLGSLCVTAQEVKITYMGTMGSLVSIDDKRFIIDGLFPEFKLGYSFPPESVTTKAVFNQKPYHNITALLVTHVHGDHFNDKLTFRYALNNDQSLVFVPPQAREYLEKFAGYKDVEKNIKYMTASSFKETFTETGYRIIALRIKHTGQSRHNRIQNIGYIIQCNGISVLHVGDSDVDEEMYKQMQLTRYNIDVAILPYWLILDGKGIINNWIKPAHVVATHLPAKQNSSITKSLHESLAGVEVFDQLLKETRFEIKK
jgi:L-ascorbate metabolism protein UlaG (beta-lactamase superfamily)